MIEITRPIFISDIDLKIQFGSILLNILYICYFPPSAILNSYDYHCHSSYELHFIPEGMGTLDAEDASFEIIPKTFYLTGPGIYHRQQADPQYPMSEYGINFELMNISSDRKSRASDNTEELIKITEAFKQTSFWFGSDEFNCISLFKRIFMEYSEKRLGYYSLIRDYTSVILINTARCYSDNRSANYLIPKKVPDDIRRITIDNFFRNYSQKLSIEDLAKQTGLSSKQLNRIIMKYYGMNFTDHLMHLRIDIAKLLLVEDQKTIEEVAYATGFSSVGYFSTLFKKLTGISPGKYRLNSSGRII